MNYQLHIIHYSMGYRHKLAVYSVLCEYNTSPYLYLSYLNLKIVNTATL